MSDQRSQTAKRVLLVEDSAGFRLIYRDLLQNRGYEVLEAEDGQQGIELARTELPDLVLLDLMLPKLHGFEVLKQIRANSATASLPVIIFSVLDQPLDIEEAKKLGANEFIVKGGAVPAQVLAKVSAYLDRQLPVENPT